MFMSVRFCMYTHASVCVWLLVWINTELFAKKTKQRKERNWQPISSLSAHVINIQTNQANYLPVKKNNQVCTQIKTIHRRYGSKTKTIIKSITRISLLSMIIMYSIKSKLEYRF